MRHRLPMPTGQAKRVPCSRPGCRRGAAKGLPWCPLCLIRVPANLFGWWREAVPGSGEADRRRAVIDEHLACACEPGA